jgi:hypothetical protein
VPTLTTEYMDIHAVTDYTQASGGGAVAGILNGAKLVLFTNNLTLTKTTPLSALVQPTYTGYAAVAITWGSAVRDSSGDIVTLSQAVPIQMGSSSDPETTITGYGIEDSGAANLLFAEVLPNPIPLVDNLTYFEIVVPFAPGRPQGKTAIVIS